MSFFRTRSAVGIAPPSSPPPIYEREYSPVLSFDGTQPDDSLFAPVPNTPRTRKRVYKRTQVVPYDPAVMENTTPVLQKLYTTLDKDVGANHGFGHLYAQSSINNAEGLVNFMSMLAAIAVGSTVAGLPFVPLIFAICAGIKSYLYTNIPAEEIIIIRNILHQYVILTSYKSVQKFVQYKLCLELKTIAESEDKKPVECAKVTSFAVPTQTGQLNEPEIIQFLSELFDEYIAQLTKIASMRTKGKKGSTESIVEIHSVCSGIFATMIQYLHMNAEAPDLEYFNTHPMFKANTSDPSEAVAQAERAEKKIDMWFKAKIALQDQSLKEVAFSMFKAMGEGAAAFSIYSLTAGKRRRTKRNRRRR